MADQHTHDVMSARLFSLSRVNKVQDLFFAVMSVKTHSLVQSILMTVPFVYIRYSNVNSHT